MGTYNGHVKFGLKIPNRFGKNVRKIQGVFFDSHCRYVTSSIVLMCIQLEPFKMRLAEQRLHSDIQRELRDFNDLERQLVRSLETIHARKRQLEIKRSRISA